MSIDVREITEAPCPAPAAERLGIERRATVLLRRRIYEADGAPVQMATSYVPVALARRCPKLYSSDTGPGGMYERFREVGRAPVVASEEVRARVPSRDEVRDLAIDGRSPVLIIWRTVYDAEATPLEAVRIVLRADRVRLTYALDMA